MISNFPLSENQIKSFNESDARLNIWCGAVRSGKTFASILRFIQLIKEKMNEPGDIMIIGVSRTSIQRNVLTDFYKILGYQTPTSQRMEDKIYGKNIYFVGAHNESSVRTIQGSTLSLAYVDEATCIPRPFWQMLLSRLSTKKATLLATCNPEAPKHWLKKDFIDRADELSLKHFKFSLDDNPSLSNEYKENLKKEYMGGHWYKRFILGEWCIAHGLIYDGFDTDNVYSEEKYEAPNYYIMGIDYGTSNATAAVLCAITPRKWPQIRVVDEYYYDSKKAGRSKTDAELADDIEKFASSVNNLESIFVDPSAASFKQELRNKDLPVMDAKNDVLDGIRVCAKFINQKNILIHSKCKNLLEYIQSYSWDEKASMKGEDKPLKEQEHILDGLRYAVFSKFAKGQIHNAQDNISIAEARRIVYGEEEDRMALF